MAHGITAETYTRVMSGVRPDTTGLEAIHNQAEFNEQLWQYLNPPCFRLEDRRRQGESARKYAPLFSRIEKDFGVEPAFMLGVWGIELAFGDPVVAAEPHAAGHSGAGDAGLGRAAPPRLLGAGTASMRWPSSSAAGARLRKWSAPGPAPWAIPNGCRKSGSISASTMTATADLAVRHRPMTRSARPRAIFVERGNYRRGEHWGYEVRLPARWHGRDASRTYAAWQAAGVTRADGEPFPQPEATARLWMPVPGGPAFLLGPNFFAAHSYNPSMNYALALVHLGDRLRRRRAFVQKFPGSEPAPTLAEVQEIQRRLTALGFDTGGADGRIGNDTMLAVRDFQRKVGMEAGRRLCRRGTVSPGCVEAR